MHIFKYLESVSWGIGSLIVIGAFVAFTIIGILLIRRIIPIKKLQLHHDVAGFVFANLGVLYAVLLGFIVVNAQQRFDRVRETINVEASILTDLYRDSEVFSEKDGHAIRAQIKNYALAVVNEEWKLMSQGKSSPKAHEAINKLWKIYYTVEIKEIRQQLWYAESINKLNQLMSSRLERLLGSVESLGTEIWVSLIMGGLLIVTFLWFFGVESIVTHILMATILASVTAFLLFLIYSLDTSFSGSVQLTPEAFENFLKSMD